MTAREVQLQGGPPWGFRMHGGADQGQPLRISRVNPGSRAASQGVREGDVITAIDGQPTASMTNSDAHHLLRSGGPTLRLGLNDSTGGPIKRRGSLRRSSEANNNTSKAANKHAEKESTGVWSPGGPDDHDHGHDGVHDGDPRDRSSPTPSAPSPVPAVWTPRSAGASPLVERKAFRPVNFTSPQLSRKARPSPADRPADSKPADADDANPNGVALHLPRAPNPTVTLLQKAREGQIPRGAQYLDGEPDRQAATSTRGPADRDRDRDQDRDQDVDGFRLVSVSSGSGSGPRKVQGLGPTTKEGVPTVLRSELRDENKDRWYKRMYDQLHKIKQDDDCVTVRYRPSHRDQRIATSGRRREGVSTQFKWPGGRTSGYQSEPELGHSDASKYYTLDRRRGPPRPQQQQQYETTRQHPQQQQQQQQHEATPPPPPPPSSVDAGVPTVTTPRSRAVSESLKYAAEVYKNQPGRIENYEPGKSSIAEKEAKQWWDEVLDIFDGMEKRNKENLQAFKPTFMTYALKESGYESDTQLVVRRREDGPGTEPLSPAQQRTAYKEIQKGGDVPLHGLRKTAPEKPKDPEPELEYTQSVQGASRAYESEPESPHRYTDSEVTIRYRSPVSALDAGGRPISEQELSRRQAEAMRRLYQEERRRKYLYELQDINSRRHTDNFTPSQKSPIPLNRYDDLLDEYWTSGRSSTPVARLAAKALYNFVGQTPRELSFRRGDVILVKRQVDRNWYEGEHNGSMGLFPANYVEVLPYDHLRATPTKRVQEGQARARYNFIAQTRLELSLAKGELVNLIRRVDENWFEGRVGNQKGIFPVSYVEVLLEPSERPATTPIPSGKPVAAPAAHSLILNGSSNGPPSMAQHSYQPPTSRSPANYSGVTAYGSVPAAAIAPNQAKHQQPVTQSLHVDTHSDPVPYRALYNYRPQNDDELELLEGDMVLVMEKCDDGWYVGSSQRTGFFGTFPGNYVERI